MALRRHLALLAALTIVPLLGLIVWTVVTLHADERARAEGALTDTARALSLAVDRDVLALAAALESLATSTALDAGDLRAFYAQAASLTAKQPAWSTIILADSSGAQLVNVLRPFGAALPRIVASQDEIQRLGRSGKPVIGTAFVGLTSGARIISIRVPVVRDGRLAYVLAGGVRTATLRDVLVAQRLPAGWIGTILDANRTIIARTRAEQQFVGQPASGPLLEASARANEGWYRGLTKEGVRTYSAFSRSSLTGLTVALGVPAEVIDAPLQRSLWRVAVAAVIVLALGVGLAGVVAGRIARPITALASAARDVARGAEPPVVAGGISEVDELSDAMRAAARLVREERETLETINRTGQLLAGELSLERLLQAVTDACTRLCRAAVGAFETFAAFPAFRGEGVVRLDDVSTDPRHGMPPGYPPVRSYLAVPVVSRSGEVLGGLFFGHPEPGRFTARHEELVQGLAPLIATAIDNARLYEQEQSARAEAEAANALKDEFLATLSHELRTPLNAVVGWTRMLRRDMLDETARRHALEVIERNADAQVRLIEDLLDVSRIITGKLRLDLRPVEPAGVVEAAVDALRPTADAKGISVQLTLGPGAGPVSGDPDRLQQIVWNLLSNAIKFTPRGGRVAVRLAAVDSHVEIAVTDTGVGIAADVLPHVFERFRQADSSSRRAYGGLGIGLALVKHLVELHGGSLAAVSPGLGHGATFTVRLPLLLQAEAATESASERQENA